MKRDWKRAQVSLRLFWRMFYFPAGKYIAYGKFTQRMAQKRNNLPYHSSMAFVSETAEPQRAQRETAESF